MSEETTNSEFDWYGPDAATFGDRIAGARENAGMTQSQLARRLGIKLSTLKAWEEDRSEPRANKLQMVSGLLGVSLSWLLSGQGHGPDGPAEDMAVPPSVSDILLEIRGIKTEISNQADKLGQLEKRLRLTLNQNDK